MSLSFKGHYDKSIELTLRQDVPLQDPDVLPGGVQRADLVRGHHAWNISIKLLARVSLRPSEVWRRNENGFKEKNGAKKVDKYGLT